MKRYIFLLSITCVVISNKVQSQNEGFSWIYFYYTNSFGARPTFTVLFNEKEAFQLEKKARVKCKIYSVGTIKISCFDSGSQKDRMLESFVTLKVQHGRTYYVKLDNTYLKLKEVDESTGEKEFNNAKLLNIVSLTEDTYDPFVSKASNSVTKVENEIIKSDVDVDIPVTKTIKNNTYVLIIGNEDYSSFQTGLNTEVNVDYALNDAKVFKEYCNKTLGIPEKQIKFLPNATSGQMNQGIAWLNNLAKIENGKAELIFYYSGHGLPDEQTKEPYLMPVDISGNNVTLAIKLNDVYTKLNEFPSKRVMVFLDACFSGGARNQGLVAMKGVKVKPKMNTVTGNMIVLSSSSGEESSGIYREKQHGYMTYFLLKKLQETKAEITCKELSDFVIEKVTKESTLDGKTQTPQLNFSMNIENDWLNWKVK
jgi:hypothetical protein